MSPITIASAPKSPAATGYVERAPDLLLASSTSLIPTEACRSGAERADVHDDVRLGVGRAATVDRAVPLGGLERRRLHFDSSPAGTTS